MKKIVLTLAALLSVASTFAANDKTEIVDAHKYVMEFSPASMSRALNLSVLQYDAVAAGEETFADETRAASRKKTEEERNAAFSKAVLRNVKYMREVLNADQYRTYLMLINTTIANRGLNL